MAGRGFPVCHRLAAPCTDEQARMANLRVHDEDVIRSEPIGAQGDLAQQDAPHASARRQTGTGVAVGMD